MSSLRAVGGGDSLNDSLSGFSSRLRGVDDGSCGDGSSGVLAAVVLWVGDTELGRVLVLAGALDNEHEAIVSDVRLELGAGGPGERTVVGDLLGNGHEGLHIGARSAEEDQRNWALGGRLPLDVVGLAGRNGLLETGLEDGIARGSLGVVRLGVSRDDSRKGGDNGGERETHYVCCQGLYSLVCM